MGRFGDSKDKSEETPSASRFGADNDHPTEESGSSEDSPVINALSHAGSQVASIPGAIANAVMHPIDTVSSIYGQQKQLAGEGVDAAKSGDYPLAAARGIETLLPGIGPNIANGFKSIKSGDVSGGIGDMIGGTGSALIAPRIARPVGRFVNAATSPEVMSKLPGATHFNEIKGGFADASKRINATAKPPMVFSVAQDDRPMNGPITPPPAVLRDAKSPRWAEFGDPTEQPPAPVNPISGNLPSGRTVGPAPQMQNVIPPRTPMWSGIQDSPEILPQPLTMPAESALPSGRIPGGIANQQAGPVAPSLPKAQPGTIAKGPVTYGKSFNQKTTSPNTGGTPGSSAITNAQAEMMRQQRLGNMQARGITPPVDEDLAPLLEQSIENARSSEKTPIRENIRRR